ncbi:MAG: hypothetical protein J7K66_07265 [Anaerolineaceae bacterium]|nr:hypothetical protein [Anaerolineaceae bacterium]
MRHVRNEIQTPKRLVLSKKRKSFAFFILVIGVVVLVVGVSGFFSAFLFRDLINARWDFSYREVQKYSLVVGGGGIILYIIAAIVLKIPLRKTTYYKVSTIIKDEPFDPARKGDFTKSIYARLRDLDDQWAYFSEVKTSKDDFKIPQVIVGPGGIFTTYPIAQNPDRRAFKDPGKEFDRASKKLGSTIGRTVLPIIVFSTPKLVLLYKEKYAPKIRVMHIHEIFKYLESKKNVLSLKQREEAEAKIYQLIDGTAPGG